MNFYSHYHYFHLIDQDEFNTGLVLPDLVKNATGQKLKNLNRQFGSAFTPLLAGCKMHIEADRWFHNSEFFHSLEQETKEIFEKCGFNKIYNKSWFVSHIMVELMLDRILIRENKQRLDGFYGAFEGTDENLLAEFLILNDVDNSSRFTEFMRKFCEVKYLAYYPEDEKFIYSLNRICQRAGLQAFDSWQINLLLNCLPVVEEAVSNKISILHDDLAAFHVKCDDPAH